MSRPTTTAVTWTYGVATTAVIAACSWLSLTTPAASPMPPAQTALHTEVPGVIPGPSVRPAGVERGEALAHMRIPRFGADWAWTVLEGASEDILVDGPGHFVDTALPGETGNAAIAAHRAGHGDPFIDFDLLEVGDRIIVAQPGAEWTYEVTKAPTIIEPGDTWVLADFAAGEWLTLITCWPKYGSEKRMYLRAELVKGGAGR